MYLCNNLLCIIKFRSKIQGCQMLKLHEHLKEEQDFTENMVNNSVQKRKVPFRILSQLRYLLAYDPYCK